ncbi:hypothetical protein Tco_0890498, partial [Tanacetum coccineum]
ILDGICLDKMKLDGEMKKEEKEVMIKIKGEALIEKEDPGAFVILIWLEGKINLNALADTGSNINVMPYHVYKELGREEVGVTTIIVKFLILDMSIDRDTPILVGRGFLYTCGSILKIIERITSTFDGLCHQTFRAAKVSLDTTESDSYDEVEYVIQRNKFGAPIYIPKPARKFKIVLISPERTSVLLENRHALQIFQENVLNQMGCGEAIDVTLAIKLFVAGTNEEFDEVCAADDLKTKKIIKFRLCGRDEHFNAQEYWLSISREENLSLSRSHASTIWNPFITRIAKRRNLLSDEVLNSLSALIYYRALDTTKLRDLIDYEGRLILEAPEPGVPRVAILRPPRASMQDLYAGVFEHMAEVYSVPLQGAYNPPGYDQQQYDQYYQQYPLQQPQQQPDDDDE